MFVPVERTADGVAAVVSPRLIVRDLLLQGGEHQVQAGHRPRPRLLHAHLLGRLAVPAITLSQPPAGFDFSYFIKAIVGATN